MTESMIPAQKKAEKETLPLWAILLAGVVLLGFLVFLAAALVRSQHSTLTLGSKVPDFSVTTFDGQTVSLAGLHGKTVVVNFWASWCTTCVDEAPAMKNVWEQVQGGGQVVFLGVDYADTQPAALAFMKQYGMDYLAGPDLRSAISQMFRVSGVPETYLIDGDGILRGIKIGPFSSADELLTFVQQKTDQ